MPKRLMNQENAPASRKAMGGRLNDERLARHLKQTELAKRANVLSHVITNIETGHVLNPTAESILRLARTLNLRPEWLLDGVGEKYVPGPVEIPEAQRIEIERVPLAMAQTLLKVVEEMQYSRLFCEQEIGVKHVERWLGCLLALPELRSIGDHFMRAALESDPTKPGAKPTLVVNNVSMLPERTVESGVELPKPENQPAVAAKVAALRAPPPNRVSKPDDDLGPLTFSLDPHKGVKLSKIKKGGYTDLKLRNRMPMRKDGLLRQYDVCALIGMSPSSFYVAQQNDPDFPKPAELDGKGNAAGYRRKDFEAYLRLKLMERKTKDVRKVAQA